MPIIGDKPTAPKTTVPTQPLAVAPEYKSAIVDSRYIPSASLLTHIEGSKWDIDYYSQVLGANDELQPLQLALDPQYQQYHYIHEMEVRVSTPLSTSQDETTKEMTVTGSAMVYPFLIPNTGDMFVADIGDGKVGVFAVTRSEKLSIRREACYQIDYVLISYLTDEYKTAFEEKTVQESYFVKDFLTYGQNPFLIDTEYHAVNSLKKGYTHLLGHYFNDFFSREYQTLLVPDQTFSTYDPFIVKALLNTMDVRQTPFVKNIRPYNCDGKTATDAINFWDCLCKLSADTLIMAAYRYGLVKSTEFAVNAQYESIRYTGIVDVVYPADDRTDVDKNYVPTSDPITKMILAGQPRTTDIRRLVRNNTLSGMFLEGVEGAEGIEALPDIHLVTHDDYYVFTEAFYYGDTAGMSKLESITQSAMLGEPIDLVVLNNLVSTAKTWGNLERFYYIPVLLILIKVAIRGI